MASRRAFLKRLLALLAGGTGLAGYAFGIEPAFRLRVQHYALTPPGWPKGLRLRATVIADVHAGAPYMPAARIGAIAAAANALTPDVHFLLGDFAAGHRWVTEPVPAEQWTAALGALKAPLGVHAVLGNHDWWDDVAAQARGTGPVTGRTALEARNIPVYENDAVRLVKDGHAFWIAGLGDQMALLERRGGGDGVAARAGGGALHSANSSVWGRSGRRILGVDDLPGTLAKITDDAPVILLAHEPDIFPLVPARVALTISGHTHGGQVRLLGYSPVVPSRYGNRFAYGHIVEDGRHLIVSGGLGCSIMPVRLGVPPEIVLLDLGGAA